MRVWRASGDAEFIWAGFARKESLGWWKKKSAEFVDVPAVRFAERSDRDGQLRWEEIAGGQVVRGLIVPNDGKPLLKIVTRASTPGEVERFEHERMPFVESPLFNAAAFEDAEELQQELF